MSVNNSWLWDPFWLQLSHTHNLYTIAGCFNDRNSPNSWWGNHFKPGKSSCLAIVQNGQKSTPVGLSFVFVYTGYTLYMQTHTFKHHTLLWVLIHLLAICPCDFPWGCWAVTLTLFLFSFLCCILRDTKDYTAVSKITQFLFNNNPASKDLKLSISQVRLKWYLQRTAHAHLFVPLLMKVTQEDVGFLCYNNCRANTVRILLTNYV